MAQRCRAAVLLLAALALSIAGCGTSEVDSLAITPAQAALTVGQTVQFTATGTYGHGTHPASQDNVTTQVTWTSSSPSVATVNPSGLATGVSAGTATITASMKGFTGLVSATATITVSAPAGSGGKTSTEPLASLSIIPTSQSLLAAHQAAQFIAIGTTSTGATVNLTNQTAAIGTATIKAAAWSSSVTSVATINATTGVATSVGTGTATITAIAKNPDGTVVAGTATLNVTISSSSSAEPVVSVAIIPASQTALAINQTAQFIAIGTTGAGTTVDLTNKANWISSNVKVATVIPTSGLATAVAAGTTAITAIVTNPDGTVVTGTAAFTVSVQATPEPLVSMTVLPASQTAYAANQTAQFIAIGTTGTGATVDLTSQAAWSSSNTSVATIGAKTGLATALTSGATAITAIATNPDGTVVTGTATFTVQITSTTEPLASLSIIPTTQTVMAVGQTAQYYAIGTTSTGETVNLTSQGATIGGATVAAATWSSTNTAVATINTTGLGTAAGTGSTAIIAMVKNPDGTVVTGSAAMTVTNPTWVSLSVVPLTQTAEAVGETAQFIAIGTEGTGLTEDLTSLATWQSSDPTVATVSTSTPGLVTAVSSGTATITARYTNPDGTVVQGSATYTVTVTTTQEPLLSLSIIPASQTVLTVNETGQFLALGTFSSDTAQAHNLTCSPTTGLTRDCSTGVTWLSSDVKVGTINSTGLATGLNRGTTAITATATNPDGTLVTGSASFQEAASGTGTQYATLTITLVGDNAANGTVTIAPTGSPAVVCSTTNSANCVYTLPLNTPVTLTATPLNGATFSGWSLPCNSSGTGACTTTVTDNETIAAIFN